MRIKDITSVGVVSEMSASSQSAAYVLTIEDFLQNSLSDTLKDKQLQKNVQKQIIYQYLLYYDTCNMTITNFLRANLSYIILGMDRNLM